MKKEKWIDEILQTAKGIQPVDSNPYLAAKVEARLQQQPVNKIPLRWVYATVAAMLVVLIINIAVWSRVAGNKQNSTVQQLVQEYGLSDHDFFSLNYSN
jgi:hypothetical protein